MPQNKLLRVSERSKHNMQQLIPDEDSTNRLAVYFQNFADQTRIKILSALSISELCVNDLSNIVQTNQTTVSHQLKLLKDQNIVACKRFGKVLVYSLKSPMVNEMMMYAVKNLNP